MNYQAFTGSVQFIGPAFSRTAEHTPPCSAGRVGDRTNQKNQGLLSDAVIKLTDGKTAQPHISTVCDESTSDLPWKERRQESEETTSHKAILVGKNMSGVNQN